MGNDALIEEHSSGQSAAVFRETQDSEQFRRLKRKHRAFVLPVTAACLLWYLTYVLLAGYAPQFMATPVFGRVNIGILFGLTQVATTFIITMVYVSYANKHLDPDAAAIRDRLENKEGVR
jgi:uncharacterized membrane protein (DUF485 family)